MPAGDKDGVLRWFEAYADALSSGRFAVEVSPALLERQWAQCSCLSQPQPPCGRAAVASCCAKALCRRVPIARPSSPGFVWRLSTLIVWACKCASIANCPHIPLRSIPFTSLQPLEAEYPESVGISLFPQLPPWRSEAVTEVGHARHVELGAAKSATGLRAVAC